MIFRFRWMETIEKKKKMKADVETEALFSS